MMLDEEGHGSVVTPLKRLPSILEVLAQRKKDDRLSEGCSREARRD